MLYNKLDYYLDDYLGEYWGDYLGDYLGGYLDKPDAYQLDEFEGCWKGG